MPRTSEKPLEKRKNLILVKGDWQRLERVLAPAGITPTLFIRELVHKTLARLEARMQDAARPVETPDDLPELDLPDTHWGPDASGDDSDEPAR